MNAPVKPAALVTPPALWPMAFRLARRDLHGGLGGYWIFLLCIALGVAAITGVGSVGAGLADGLAHEGRTILGGDAAVSTVAQPIDEAQTAYLAARGHLSSVIGTRAMARHGAESALVDIKAVDGAYPGSGRVDLDPPQGLAATLAERDGAYGVAAEDTITARLGLKVGDTFAIGSGTFVLRAILRGEPDRLASGIAFAPRVLLSQDALKRSGLIQPGSLARFTTRIDLGGPTVVDDAALTRFVADAKAAFPAAGWDVKTRQSVSPEFDRNLARFTQFLTLVGLTALVVGGVGVANAVQAAMDRKRPSLATLKALGAPGRTIFAMGLTQVMLVASIGVAAGLAVGTATPFAIASAFGSLIPFPLLPSVHPGVLGLGAFYGLATTLVFSLGALGRAHDVPVSALFRAEIDPETRPLRRPYRIGLCVSAVALTGAAIGFSNDHRLAAYYVAATLCVFGLLRLVAFGFTALARALPHARHVGLRLALANIHRPGALTPAVVLSLGLGLTLMVALTLIDDNIHRQVEGGKPGVTPSFFFVDVPSRQADAFAAFVKAHAPDATLDEVPMMRGRITALNGTPAEQIKPKEGAAWVLEGDRGITYAAAVPRGSAVVAGDWWPDDYHGLPLVSFDREMADGLGLKLGDSVTVNVLGRNLTAKVANLRKIDWQSLGINFVMVFSPSSFAGAPHMVLATAAFPPGSDPALELGLAKDVAAAYPTVSSVRVKDVLEAIDALVGKLAIATRGASAVTIVASVLVLAGALAAGRRARVYDAVVLKVLGATRGRLLGIYLMEYGILGLGTAIFGVLAGTAAAAAVVEQVMRFDFAFDWRPAIEAALASLAVTVGLGLAGTWRILGRSAAGYLRQG